MIGNTLFLIGIVVAVAIGFAYFRDLGDVSQMILRVKRKNMIRFIRNEYRLLIIGFGATVLMALAHFGLDGGPRWLFWIALPVLIVLYGFPDQWADDPADRLLCGRSICTASIFHRLFDGVRYRAELQ